MSRRDMIIVAVLINAGLLVMLFVSSLKHDAYPLSSAQEIKTQKTETIESRKEIQLTKAPVDQVDKILSDLNKQASFEKQENSEKSKAVASVMPHASTIKDELGELRYVPLKQDKKEESILAKANPLSDAPKIVVKKGDVLEKIAKQYGTTTDTLMQLNDLKGSNLKIGQVLYLPKEAEKKEATKPSVIKQAQVASDGEYYIVKNGDNLWKIAIENHVKIDELLKLNQLTEKKAKALRPGDKLKIR